MTNETQETILWHDYETFGVNPRVDFPVQFAAIRTNLELDVLDNQANIDWLCKMPLDYLPHPKACLVTGITPSYSLTKGLSEPAFANKIYHQMSQSNTCVAGYNSMRFDEEVTRHLFFRNLFPVYEREFKNNNSRWDVIDLVRACYALRPEGINWPFYDDGKPCFKLEELTKANDIGHEVAHNALSDVHATIGIAKLIKTKQPKLYDYYWQLRNKHQVNDMLQQFQNNIFVHISGFIASSQGCCSLIMPVCLHPSNKNAVLCIDLLKPIDLFEENNIQKLQHGLFAKTSLDEGNAHPSAESPRIYNIAVNKCPFVAPIKTLSAARTIELGINLSIATQHYKRLAQLPFLKELCTNVYTQDEAKPVPNNIDEQLYTSGFPSPADTHLMDTVRQALPEQLTIYSGKFESELLNKLLFRYRARNYPSLLDEQEMKLWQQHVEDRLTLGGKTSCLSLEEYLLSIDELSQEYQQHTEKMKILQALKHYAQQLTGM
ncbi:MAG: exodeoxyribonuclease-1 [Alphaproteobacteria bacterium]|jgi:exodeoxyribonuclease-1